MLILNVFFGDGQHSVFDKSPLAANPMQRYDFFPIQQLNCWKILSTREEKWSRQEKHLKFQMNENLFAKEKMASSVEVFWG